MGCPMFVSPKTKVIMLKLPIRTQLEVGTTLKIIEQLEVGTSLERILSNQGLIIGITPTAEEVAGEVPSRVYPEIE